MSKWIAVSQSLPDTESPVIVKGRYNFSDEPLEMIAVLKPSGDWLGRDPADDDPDPLHLDESSVTHWLPLDLSALSGE